MNPIAIHVNTWLAGTTVTVQIDDSFPSDQFGGLESGNQQWNNSSLATCTGVKFEGFDPIFIPPEDLEETPPDGYLVWQRDDPQNGKNGVVIAETAFAGTGIFPVGIVRRMFGVLWIFRFVTKALGAVGDVNV